MSPGGAGAVPVLLAAGDAPWEAAAVERLERRGSGALLRRRCVDLPDLLAVDAGSHLRMAYPLTNAEQSATRFTITPEEHFGALRHAEARGWRIGGVFHSHPAGGAVPSPVDLAQPHDPDWLHLVVGLSPRPQLRAWRYLGGAPVEIPVT